MSHASPRHILPALGLLALACGTALAAPPAAPASRPAAAPAAPDPVQQLQLASRQYAELQQMLALDQRCHWLEPIARTAMEATAQERLAWFDSHGGTAGHAQAAAEQAIASEASLDCKSGKANSLAEGVRHAAWQMRVTWALRAEALLDAPDRPAWFKGKSSVAGQRAALQETVATLLSRYDVSIKAAQAGIQKEAEQMLATRCTAADSGCRPENGSATTHTYAREWLKQAEAYAAALSGVRDKVGSPPDATPR